MKILLVPVGSAGDVHPYVPIGVALRNRGHDVTMIANPHFERLIARVGLDMCPLGTEAQYLEVTEHPDLWDKNRGVTVIASALRLATPEIYDAIRRRHRPNDTLIVGSGLAFGARIASETLRIPMVTLHLQPSCLYSVLDSPVMHPAFARINSWPTVVKRLVFWATDLAADRVMAPAANELRTRLGLPPVRHITSAWWHSPTRVIGLFPDWFAAPQPDWPPQTVLTGFPLYDERGATATMPEVGRFLDDGSPPIVFAAGSGNRQGRRFFETAVDACRQLQRRGVLLSRFAEQIPTGMGDAVRHFDYVPLSEILPRAAALVHHGGIGTMAQGLAAGVPQLVMPMTFDQPDNASRLARLGAGRALSPQAFTGPAVAHELASLMASPEVAQRCRGFAARLQASDAVARTCDLIEEVGGRG